MFVGITRDGFTFDILHHEIWQAVFRGPAIDQAGNVRVIQVGEDLALHQKAFDDGIGVHAALDELQRDLPIESLIRSSCEINGAHPAAANLANDFVGANALAYARLFVAGFVVVMVDQGAYS